MFTRLRPEVNQWKDRFGIAILYTIFAFRGKSVLA